MALSLQRYTYWLNELHINRILKERNEKERERCKAIVIENGDVLPECVIIEILSWLPVKALLQFKSVCKSWYAIIASPHFISKHLKNHYKTSDNDCLLAHFHQSPLELVELLVDETPQIQSAETLWQMPMCGSEVHGPCDGIFYLNHYSSDRTYRALWNPSTNELKVLPPIIPKPNLSSHLIYSALDKFGFGYDPFTEDFKVVIIKRYWNASPDDYSEITQPPSAIVYSLHSDSWRHCGDLPRDYHLENNRCYIFINGCSYWLGSPSGSGNADVVVCFDITTDAFQEIPVPNYMLRTDELQEIPVPDCTERIDNMLIIHQNSLAFLSVHEAKKHFVIWTLKEGIWIKNYSVATSFVIWMPVGYWKQNKVILQDVDGDLFLCDPDTQEIAKLGLDKFELYNCTLCHGTFIYKESLVSIQDKIKNR